MLKLSLPPFGLPISLHNAVNNGNHVMGANALLSQFLNVKKNYRKDLDSLTEGDVHACRYFCADDIAYVFSIDIMKAIAAAIESHGPKTEGCVIFFQGLRKEKINLPDGSQPLAFGRPTLIATAYVAQDDNLQRIDIPFPLGSKDTVEAFEHPGDGTGGTTPSSLFTLQSPNPSTVIRPNDDPLGEADFTIMDTIPIANISAWPE